MDALKYAPKVTHITANWTRNDFWDNWADVPTLDLPTQKQPDWTNLIYRIFEPQDFTAHSARTVIIVIVIALLLGVLCFFSKDCFRWAKTFFLISNPKKYWTQYKGLYIPYFDKMSRDERDPNIERAPGFSVLHSRLGDLFRRKNHHETEMEEMESSRKFFDKPTGPIISRNAAIHIREQPKYPDLKEARIATNNLPIITIEQPDIEVAHDTTEIESDYRLESHKAALRLKAINAHKNDKI